MWRKKLLREVVWGVLAVMIFFTVAAAATVITLPRAKMTVGNILYASSASKLDTVTNGTSGQVLRSNGDAVPTYTSTPPLRVTFESTTSTPSAITMADCGKVIVMAKTSSPQAITLPAAATAGCEFTFINGHASNEIQINVVTGDNIVGKTHGAENGAGINTSANTGIKNTDATNVVGDFVTLVSNGATTWYMKAVAGVWASQ